MAKRRKQTPQQIKIDGFRFPYQLLQDIRTLKDEGAKIHSSMYAALLIILKQIYLEGSSKGYVQELNLSKWAKQLGLAYSSVHNGRVQLEKLGILYEEQINDKRVWVLRNFKEYTTPELPTHFDLNYFLIPHSLLDTNIIAELVRTSNAPAFELMFSLFNQFRNGIKKVSAKNEVSYISYERTMATLKQQLNKRAKAVRDVLSIMEPLFDMKLIGAKFHGKQLWVSKVQFSLREECVKENTDAFEVAPLLQEFREQTQYIFDGLHIRYKSRDLFDVMISYKQEVVDIFKYVTDLNKKESPYEYNFRDSFLQSYYYHCLTKFEEHIKQQKEKRGKFVFHTSIGAYFRTIFRNVRLMFLKKIPHDILHEAKYREFKETGNIPSIQLLG